MSKNNNRTINVRTHNPYGQYKSKDLDDTNSNNNNPNDNLNEEFAAEWDAKAKNKDNATNHDKDMQSNKRKNN